MRLALLVLCLLFQCAQCQKFEEDRDIAIPEVDAPRTESKPNRKPTLLSWSQLKETVDDPVEVSGEEKRKKDKRAPVFNYASIECGAKVVASNSEATNSGNILNKNKDAYMLSPCSASKFIAVELCEELAVEAFEIANYELYSSGPATIEILVAPHFPVPMDSSEWVVLGRFDAAKSRQKQRFTIDHAPIWSKFVQLRVLSHHGSEFYCPLSEFKVYGTTLMEDFKDGLKDHDTDVVAQVTLDEDGENLANDKIVVDGESVELGHHDSQCSDEVDNDRDAVDATVEEGAMDEAPLIIKLPAEDNDDVAEPARSVIVEPEVFVVKLPNDVDDEDDAQPSTHPSVTPSHDGVPPSEDDETSTQGSPPPAPPPTVSTFSTTLEEQAPDDTDATSASLLEERDGIVDRPGAVSEGGEGSDGPDSPGGVPSNVTAETGGESEHIPGSDGVEGEDEQGNARNSTAEEAGNPGKSNGNLNNGDAMDNCGDSHTEQTTSDDLPATEGPGDPAGLDCGGPDTDDPDPAGDDTNDTGDTSDSDHCDSGDCGEDESNGGNGEDGSEVVEGGMMLLDESHSGIAPMEVKEERVTPDSIFKTLTKIVKALQANQTLTNLYLEKLNEQYLSALQHLDDRVEIIEDYMGEINKTLHEFNVSRYVKDECYESRLDASGDLLSSTAVSGGMAAMGDAINRMAREIAALRSASSSCDTSANVSIASLCFNVVVVVGMMLSSCSSRATEAANTTKEDAMTVKQAAVAKEVLDITKEPAPSSIQDCENNPSADVDITLPTGGKPGGEARRPSVSRGAERAGGAAGTSGSVVNGTGRTAVYNLIGDRKCDNKRSYSETAKRVRVKSIGSFADDAQKKKKKGRQKSNNTGADNTKKHRRVQSFPRSYSLSEISNQFDSLASDFG